MSLSRKTLSFTVPAIFLPACTTHIPAAKDYATQDLLRTNR
ncbi:hypothetical protein SAMN06295933_1801 [Desulfovibrio gilichinskyi]|uniref:Uncharacterized protein n=1 Tax=Desulfovibrio gilichinskyi TaxID=1519643 RepID=A0A1X7DFU4_9BACT|nr:hypothetical protein SAMN06295933_1801 [Desulfovibrio gilichinskyi]